ncbi:hypothetical protein FEM48_Zijuj06G0084100 [Ziziphus jujuba var. spinosa]|uniref:Gamma carbonic anhydrase 1, mitochondrial-like n=1 Tax=Ziziphus jujuba var. spinosa TaxID=714518 RepID=A0A978V874_ZIZJJ|nr:hypothetical protein FEM48_Zijuj06G0084100 [Ziziphus jujuba var. spinosa]
MGCVSQDDSEAIDQLKLSLNPFCIPFPTRAFILTNDCTHSKTESVIRIVLFYKHNLLLVVFKHRTLMNIFDKAPVVDKDAFVAPSASIIGDVLVGRGSSVWYGCVLRGDVNSISVGSGTNIQDNSLVHVAKSNLSGKVLPTIIGDNVTVGHSAVLHGCTVEDEAFVGMGATLLDGVVVEKNAMVAAGALVRQNTRIPCGEVWGGNPARFLRKLTDEEIAFISQSATNYSNLAQVHAAENAKPLEEIEFEKVLRKKFARRDEEYDSMLGVVRETPPELILPDNVLPDKTPKASQK